MTWPVDFLKKKSPPRAAKFENHCHPHHSFCRPIRYHRGFPKLLSCWGIESVLPGSFLTWKCTSAVIHGLGWMLESPGDLQKYWCLGPTREDAELLGPGVNTRAFNVLPGDCKVQPRQGLPGPDSKDHRAHITCPSHSSLPPSYRSPSPAKFSQGLMTWQTRM